jgi:hypothetical protein
MTVAHLVKSEESLNVHISRQLNPILSQLNPFHTPKSRSMKVYYNIPPFSAIQGQVMRLFWLQSTVFEDNQCAFFLVNN